MTDLQAFQIEIIKSLARDQVRHIRAQIGVDKATKALKIAEVVIDMHTAIVKFYNQELGNPTK